MKKTNFDKTKHKKYLVIFSAILLIGSGLLSVRLLGLNNKTTTDYMLPFSSGYEYSRDYERVKSDCKFPHKKPINEIQGSWSGSGCIFTTSDGMTIVANMLLIAVDDNADVIQAAESINDWSDDMGGYVVYIEPRIRLIGVVFPDLHLEEYQDYKVLMNELEDFDFVESAFFNSVASFR